MRTMTRITALGGLLAAATFAAAQRPGDGPEAPSTKSADAQDLITRMFAFNRNNDGKLTKAEVTDSRLHRLFDRADADKDGAVTKEELTALADKEHSDEQGFGGPGGPGGPGGGPGGPGGPPMMFPRPGEVLPAMLQQRLKLTPEQKNKVENLQKEVDLSLDKILDDDQKKQLKEMRERGPGMFGPGGRRGPGGGPGGPGGGPRGGGPGGGGRPPGGGPPPDDDRPR